jgi:hypothetical protein
MLFTTQETTQEFLTRMDESGDSYTEPVDSETLKEVCVFFFMFVLLIKKEKDLDDYLLLGGG